MNTRLGIGTPTPSEVLEVNGNGKMNALFLPVNSASATAYRLRSDGNYLHYANGSAVEKQISYVDNIRRVFVYTPTANFTISAIKTAVESAGLIFNDIHIIVELGANNFTCSIDLGVKNYIFTMERRGTGSISFSSTRTLIADDSVLILAGSEGSFALLRGGTSSDFLIIKNK